MNKPTYDILLRHKVFVKSDTRFSASARLLQGKWRIKSNLPIGVYKKRLKNEQGKIEIVDCELGSLIDEENAQTTGSNFLTDRIKSLVQNEVYKAKAEGSLISEPRIWNNLLSSQPLCFNLFGEMHFDLKLASKFFKKLFPNLVGEVTAVKFEYSPGRGCEEYTGDNSAFDVFIEYNNEKNKNGFIGIEVKYAESLRADQKKALHTFNKHKSRYLELSNDSKVFSTDSFERLKQEPLQQIWRDHLLSFATVKDYDEGFFVYLFPSKNTECQIAVDEYITLLSSNEEEKTRFYPRHLELFINTLWQLKKSDWAKELKERYIEDKATKRTFK